MSYRFTSTFLLTWLTFAGAAYQTKAAQLQLLAPTTVIGRASLNGSSAQDQIYIPTKTTLVDSLNAYKRGPNLSMAYSETDALFSNGQSNSLHMWFRTDAFATSGSPRALSETGTVNSYGGYLPVWVRPESWAGESNGQRVLVTLSATYRGTGNTTANGGYNSAKVWYRTVPTNGTTNTFLSDYRTNGQNYPYSTSFYTTMNSYFWIKPYLSSWAPASLNHFGAELDLRVTVKRLSGSALSAYSVPEPTSLLGLLLTGTPATARLRRRRLA